MNPISRLGAAIDKGLAAQETRAKKEEPATQPVTTFVTNVDRLINQQTPFEQTIFNSGQQFQYSGTGSSPAAGGLPIEPVPNDTIPTDYPDSETLNSIDNFVHLISKVEQAYPGKTRDEILAGLRRMGGYDNENFQNLYDTEPGFDIQPTGDLTSEDIENLDNMIEHSTEGGAESGVIVDKNGETVAAGHVLTGLQAGFNYNAEADLNPGGVKGFLGQFSDHDVDNLFTSTLAGDLGQTAWQVQDGNTEVEGNSEYSYIGDGTEATFAELNGDIDGAVLGTIINRDENSTLYQKHENGAPISELIETYYDRNSGSRYENAAGYLEKQYGEGYLEDQTIRFADNYDKGNQGIGSNIADIPTGKNTEANAEAAVQEYYAWLETKLGRELDLGDNEPTNTQVDNNSGHVPAPVGPGQSAPSESVFDNNPNVNNAGVPVAR